MRPVIWFRVTTLGALWHDRRRRRSLWLDAAARLRSVDAHRLSNPLFQSCPSVVHFVDAQPTKGALVLSTSRDKGYGSCGKHHPRETYMKFLFYSREMRDLRRFRRIEVGRTYVLKFESADHKHFVRPLPFLRLSVHYAPC